jgi:hypothetical protein
MSARIKERMSARIKERMSARIKERMPVSVKELIPARLNHNPSNGRLQKVTTSPFTFILKMFGGHSSVLDGL